MRSAGWGVIAIAVVVISVLTLSALHPSGAGAELGASGQTGLRQSAALLAPPSTMTPEVKPLAVPTYVHCKSCGRSK